MATPSTPAQVRIASRKLESFRQSVSRSAAAISGYASEREFRAVQAESQHLRKIMAEDMPEIHNSLKKILSSSKDMFIENKRLKKEIEKLKKNYQPAAQKIIQRSSPPKMRPPSSEELHHPTEVSQLSSHESDDDVSLSQALDQLESSA